MCEERRKEEEEGGARKGVYIHSPHGPQGVGVEAYEMIYFGDDGGHGGGGGDGEGDGDGDEHHHERE